jgi:transposase
VHTLDDKLEPKAVRRLEVITGAGRRRAWSREEKARIVEETLASGAVVSQIARRHGATPQQVFGWRREARQRAAADRTEPPMFAPVVVDGENGGTAGSGKAMIEIVIGAAMVRVPPNADAATLKTILRVLKAVS